MKSSFILVVLTCVAVLTGCAGRVQPPVALDQNFWQKENPRVGVSMTSAQQPAAYLSGADCLLCLAAANIANSELIDHMPTLPAEDLLSLEAELVDTLNAQGLQASAVTDSFSVKHLKPSSLPEGAEKDFSPWADTYDYLLIVDVSMFGTHRSYSGYIPTSDPQAVVKGRVYMVDMSNNQYVLYDAFHTIRAVDGEWDEAPTFPGVTNAYFQAIESSKDNIKGLVAKARCKTCGDTAAEPAVAVSEL
ncbi:hypothetical protein [Allohahella marinimesophila]|uniref:Lipoprotein n=1 Tax=Allohahella marinimesophila TaxID=1054972 RepID=A0ABP7NS60_9GAMM